MNIWIIIAFICAGIVYLLDLLLRRKKWKDNTKTEKISLIMHMVVASVYVFTSMLGLLWGVTGSSADTAFGEILYDVTITMAAFDWLVASVAAIGAFILRKKNKTKASIWIHVFALSYIIIVFVVNSITSLL